MRARCTSLLALAAVAVVPACSYQGVSTDDSSFACAPISEACPPGQACVDGLCVERDDDGPDAGSSDQPDGAARADASSPVDAAALADAAPPPDAAVPSATTLTFGENSIATVRGTLDDTFLAEDQPNDGHGQEQSISVDAGPNRFGLVRIDVSTIPPGSTVESAQLVLTLNDPVEDGRIEGQVLRERWTEFFATFTRADFNDAWSTAGAGGNAVVGTVIASFEGRTANTDVLVDLPPAVVQAWVDVPATNFGIRWRSTSPTDRGGQWYSSESDVATRRPYLRVTFRPAT